METLRNVEWLEPLVTEQRDREVEAYASERVGSVPPHARYLAQCPWILRADLEFDIGCAHVNDLTDLVYMTVSRDNACRFCHGAVRMFLRMGGMSDSQIDQLEEDIDTARVEPRIDRSLDFARKLSRCKPAPGAVERGALRELGLSEDAIRELALFAGVVIFHNRFGTLLALPVRSAERISRTPLARLVRFFYKGSLASLARRGRHEVQGDSMRAGPFGNLTAALDGLPHARVLRGVIDDAWASPHLSPRCRALAFAVVARGLGAESCELEARRLAEAEGLTAGAIDEILERLASSELTAEEAQILPYTRETIWYVPSTIQKRGRDLREKIGNDAFLDTVGTAALANMVCRVSMAIDVG
jgi:alkylhydroperoxidase family enzyme